MGKAFYSRSASVRHTSVVLWGSLAGRGGIVGSCAGTSRLLAVAGLAVCLTAPAGSALTPLPIGHDGYDDAAATIYRDHELTSITVTMAPADLNARGRDHPALLT